MSDNALDLVVLILCLAILTPLGIKSILPVAKEVSSQYNDSLGDKTAPTVQGYTTYQEYDGTMDVFKVILTTQVQDYCMPAPRKLTVKNADGTYSQSIDITSMYRPDILAYGNLVYNFIKQNTLDTKYRIVYDFRDKDNEADDTYTIEVVN